MDTMLLEFGVFNIALILLIYYQNQAFKGQYRDCVLFGRLLLATAAVLFIDTLGWVIDGKPIGGQIWITTVVDGLDLIVTTVVCWCWVQYALFIAHEEKPLERKWYQDPSSWLLILQGLLVGSSQYLGFYYTVDGLGVYHRDDYYIIHSIISLLLLTYSSGSCLLSYLKEQDKEKERELLFVALIIAIPVLGNIFQLYVYGYPTVWLCMVFMILAVFIHIQNKRVNKERQLQNEQLAKALLQARAANDAKTDFLARMSHDMRTPMNGILGISYLLEEPQPTAKIKELVRQLRDSGEYLLQLINDVLDVNRIESGSMELKPTVCDEKQVFDSIIELLQPQLKAKGITLNFIKIKIDWKYMEMDVPRVKQIFINLLSNAIKYSHEGGQIDFIMELVWEKEDILRDRFVIRDSGIGMEEGFVAHAFEPFAQENRLKEALGGTGLGMTIAKSIALLMGGDVEVKSKPNEGTEVTVYLNFPLAAKPVTEPQATAAASKLPPHLRLLMCEDHPLNAKVASRLLEKAGAQVVWREDGRQGLEAFRSSEEDYFDAVLMDIRMPVMDGLEAAQAIRNLPREDARSIPIIAITANAYEEDVRKTLAAGMNAHLAKPLNPKLMYETITRQVQQRTRV